ncbi:ABC transporter permease [Caldimonas thermodepolymerans]|uniref:Monosaccharide ABC transporter membrane protein (CUT2 family) n=1 Tax=Caldimonas thermodepolymerans TaxID=215580 RepID=A0AA46HUE4_9BURK|nr:ABC transporter permease [Caldimonas thermodepolymerans]RDH95120.1 monosaccharide ABC transporter membrane protein (CUT2 family) [Caldimonas thermodepolymerans]TCP03255.1 monosaccharide ABC transporter membrane protein (CUT2 family) [Caldimonas thermodepolymerans]UZG44283.1 ABC transporter permease [Caldimonas thermodepolymerans]UZG47949.1 ABC transporter permease [Caldimonas thermodepolymerans]
MRELLNRATAHRLFWPLVTLTLLLLVNAVINPGFLRLQWRDGHLYGSLVDILNRAAPLMLVSLGMTLVIATRGIDISVGATVAISAAVAALMIGGQLVIVDGVPTHVSRFPMWAAIAGALAVGAVAGLWNGVLVAKVGMQPIIATLILMVAGRGIAQLLTNGQIITIYYAPYFFIGSGFLLGLPFALFVAAAVWGALHLLLTRTALGLFIQAIGINPQAARVAGVRARLITVGAYVFCGVTAAMAGLLISSNVKSADGNNAGLLLELDAILAVTLGGTLLTGGRFSLAGSVIGALIIQTLTSTIYSIGVPPEVNLVVKAAVVFAVMLLQSAEFRALLRRIAVRPPREPVEGWPC